MAYIKDMGNRNFVVPVRVIVPAHVPIGPANMTRCLPNVHSWLDVLDGIGVKDIDPRGYHMEALRKRLVPPTSGLEQKVMDILLHYNHRLGNNVPHRVHLVSRQGNRDNGVGPLMRRRGQRFSPRILGMGRVETIEEEGPSNNEPQVDRDEVLRNNPNPQGEAGPSGFGYIEENAVAENSAQNSSTSFREEMASPELSDIQFKTPSGTRYAQIGGACPTLRSQAGQFHSGNGDEQPQPSVGGEVLPGGSQNLASNPARDENSPVSLTWNPHKEKFVPTYKSKADEKRSGNANGSGFRKPATQSGPVDGTRGFIGPLRRNRSPLFGVQTTSEQQAPRINGSGEIGVEANRMQGNNGQQSNENNSSTPHLARLLRSSPIHRRPTPIVGSFQGNRNMQAAQAPDTSAPTHFRGEPTNAANWAPQLDNQIRHERANHSAVISGGREARQEDRSQLSMLATVATNRPRLDVSQVNNNIFNEPTFPFQPTQFQQYHNLYPFQPSQIGGQEALSVHQYQPDQQSLPHSNPQQIQWNYMPTHQNGLPSHRQNNPLGFQPYNFQARTNGQGENSLQPSMTNPVDFFQRSTLKLGPTQRMY